MKIRNYGNFKRILFDKRLKTLISYLPKDHPIHYDTIIREFDDYDKFRENIFKIIHTFEEKIINDKNLEIGRKENYIPFSAITQDNELIDIRNAFFHHAYPEVKICNLNINTDSRNRNNVYLTREIIDYCVAKFSKHILNIKEINYL